MIGLFKVIIRSGIAFFFLNARDFRFDKNEWYILSEINRKYNR